MKRNVLRQVVPPKENVSYIMSSLDVYKRLSPDAYYLYVSLINSKSITFSPNIQWARNHIGSERKGDKAVKELQDKGLLEIRQVAHRSYVWLIHYTFNDIKKMMEVKSIAMEKQEQRQEKKNEIMEQVKLWEEILENATGDLYEEAQQEIIKLKELL